MRYIKRLDEAQNLLSCLASPMRIKIIELLKLNSEMSLDEIAKKLNITNGALTSHIKVLEEAQIINIRLVPLYRGTKKMCSLLEDKLIIELFDKQNSLPYYELELNVGQYDSYSVNSPCGLATTQNVVGGYDSEIYFSYPDRFNADLVWFTNGYVLYKFPFILKESEKVKEIQITVEMASEAPGGAMDYPTSADITVNGIKVGSDYLPGERFDRKGRLTPSWWKANFGQYGWLKLYTINEEGTFFNGEKVSDVSLNDLKLYERKTIELKISCLSSKESEGGITLFGKNFGDQSQGIKLRVIYEN